MSDTLDVRYALACRNRAIALTAFGKFGAVALLKEVERNDG